MREIEPIMVPIKVFDGEPDLHCLVHDGKQALALLEPGRRAAVPAGHTVLVGTKSELEGELARLKLPPPPTPEERRALQLATRPTPTPAPGSEPAPGSSPAPETRST